ncbi:Group II intron-encoded protein ltrA,Retron-typereverse transcriptase,Reverse transcriptase (RNA-dependentDNA polymerase) (plasmid) [Escherichia coli]|nr:Group II intron-encoded protein ltrA,Retron-typereverse transcriptase,Reverse transcriptase (RNA-dependentDNA polymerase) [Escherichia coli]
MIPPCGVPRVRVINSPFSQLCIGASIQRRQYRMTHLGIPTVSDRIAQGAIKLFMEEKLDPIFHADSYGYRPGKSAHDALKQCAIRCWRYSWILEVDISAFFDHVRHDLVLKAPEHHGIPRMRSLPFDFGIRFQHGWRKPCSRT